ncbi:MAG: DUF4198 domain-containing protein [Thermodesulforhabdaceae bacterium]|jgi:nickel transport protein
MLRKGFVLFLVSFALILAPKVAQTHDFWIEKKNGNFWVIHGHDGKPEEYDPSRVIEVKAFGVNGKVIPVKTNVNENGFFFVPKKQAYAVTVTFDNKYWVKTTDGWKNIGKVDALKESLNVIESGRSFKFSKYIEKWSDTFKRPLGTEMEVIPLKNPLNLKIGDTLPIKVVYNGRPVSDVSITINWSHDEKAKTDTNGFVNVAVEKTGLNLVSAKTKVPIENDPNADIMYLNATLVFEVKQ